MKLKIAIPTALIAASILVSTGFAAAHKSFESGKTYHALSAGSGQNNASINRFTNPSDIYISNYTGETLNFNVDYPYPSRPVVGSLRPRVSVDAYSTYVLDEVYVMIASDYGQVIFDQYVPNHSIINVTYQNGVTAGKDGVKLKATLNS